MKQQDPFDCVSAPALLREAHNFNPVTGSHSMKEDPKHTLVSTKMTQRMGNPVLE